MLNHACYNEMNHSAQVLSISLGRMQFKQDK